MEHERWSEEHHLELEDLAALAEGRTNPELPQESRDHLATCRTCMSAYAEAVRYRAAWLSSRNPFIGAAPAMSRPRAQRPVPGGAQWILAATALAAAVLLSVSVPSLLIHRPEPMPTEIRRLLERASGVGLVMLGGEAGAAITPTAYRSGSHADAAEEQAIENLRLHYEGGHRSADALYELGAGLVASDRLDLARDYVAEGRRRFPADHRMLLLDGILAYRSHDLAEAERILEAARRRARRDPVVALDLGLVQLEKGAPDLARPLLQSLIDAHPGSPLAQRARQALSEPASSPSSRSR